MKEYVLNYYPKFKCIADKCKHTCCAGWKVNIDEKTLSDYKNERFCFSKPLKKGVNFKKANFKSDKHGRCAFLNGDGLCEIIINLGEDKLCQVCRDHPRFRSFFNDRVETGLGFCCEEATRIILSFKDKIQPLQSSDDKLEEELDFNQKNVIEFRQSALDIIQDRNSNINDRIDRLLRLCHADFLSLDFNRIIKTFLSFERLDKDWTKRLKNLKKRISPVEINQPTAHWCEQFLSNELYRHLSSAEDTMWVRARAIGCVLSWWIIYAVIENESANQDDFSLTVDVVRAFSAEVEYSQKNLDKLFRFAHKFIKLR